MCGQCNLIYMLSKINCHKDQKLIHLFPAHQLKSSIPLNRIFTSHLKRTHQLLNMHGESFNSRHSTLYPVCSFLHSVFCYNCSMSCTIEFSFASKRSRNRRSWNHDCPLIVSWPCGHKRKTIKSNPQDQTQRKPQILM